MKCPHWGSSSSNLCAQNRCWQLKKISSEEACFSQRFWPSKTILVEGKNVQLLSQYFLRICHGVSPQPDLGCFGIDYFLYNTVVVLKVILWESRKALTVPGIPLYRLMSRTRVLSGVSFVFQAPGVCAFASYPDPDYHRSCLILFVLRLFYFLIQYNWETNKVKSKWHSQAYYSCNLIHFEVKWKVWQYLFSIFYSLAFDLIMKSGCYLTEWSRLEGDVSGIWHASRKGKFYFDNDCEDRLLCPLE